MKSLLVSLFVAALALGAAIAEPSGARAASAAEIQHDANETLHSFVRQIGGAQELANKAVGILVFPSVIKAGFGIGGEYGEGALRADGKTRGYYSTASASIGFQIGLQGRSIVILFMTKQSLRNFHRRDGWEIGVDGSVTIIDVGAAAQVDTNNLADPIIGFVFDGRGLMYNLTLEGSKISQINR